MSTLTITVELPEGICAAAGLRERELPGYVAEIVAIDLYRQGRVSFGKAAEIAGLSRRDMMQRFASHGVVLSYDAADAEDDLARLRTLVP